MPREPRRRRARADQELTPGSVDPDLAEPGSGPGRRARPGILAAIAVGGIAGTLARYGISRAIHVAPGTFPWATFTTNITGSLVLGALLTVMIERWPPARSLRPFAAIGFLGAFTTFSTYMVETDLLAKDGHLATAAVYVVASTVGGLLAVGVGVLGARRAFVGRAG